MIQAIQFLICVLKHPSFPKSILTTNPLVRCPWGGKQEGEAAFHLFFWSSVSVQRGMSGYFIDFSSLSFRIRFLTEGKQPAEPVSDAWTVGVCLSGLPEEPSLPSSEGMGVLGRQEGWVICLHPSISVLQGIRAEHSNIGERSVTVKAHGTEWQSSRSAVLGNPHLFIYFFPQQAFFSLLFMLVQFSSGSNSSVKGCKKQQSLEKWGCGGEKLAVVKEGRWEFWKPS